jgi:elongation factor Tu
MTNHTAYKFTAILTLLPTENGGRRKPVYDHYRPSFSFSSKNHISGEISFPDNEFLEPGSTASADILLPSRHIRQNLKSGDSFTILEGNKLVGTGVIKVIVEEVRDIVIH